MTTELYAVEATTTLRDAAELIAERHVGGLPVVEGGRLAGVVSATDILAFAVATPPEAPAADAAADADDEPAEWDGDDDAPARFFAERWATEADEVDERFADERFAEPVPAPHDPLAAHTVGEIMTRDVLALPPTADLATAARCMRDAEIHRLLVVDRGVLVGIVTTSDLARAVANGMVGRRTYVFESRRGRRAG